MAGYLAMSLICCSCSSLSGLLTENGPFTWEAGTLAPVQNPYSWTNLTNMLWVEQPVGVGYSQGSPNITDEVCVTSTGLRLSD
jgi:carboxypeptidase D